jgi:hypothetical protein
MRNLALPSIMRPYASAACSSGAVSTIGRIFSTTLKARASSPALLKRFENDALRLFEKHGIKQVGFWTVAIGESNNDLYLILQWESLAER